MGCENNSPFVFKVTNIIDNITQVITSPLNDMGYEIVQVKIVNQDILQILLDKAPAITIEDCARATSIIKNLLFVANINYDFYLEVSSPGIERPLVKPADYERFTGKNIKLVTNFLVSGRKKFEGLLLVYDQQKNIIQLKTEDDIIYDIALENIKNANLKVKFK